MFWYYLIAAEILARKSYTSHTFFYMIILFSYILSKHGSYFIHYDDYIFIYDLLFNW
jgi:hypothetical protein